MNFDQQQQTRYMNNPQIIHKESSNYQHLIHNFYLFRAIICENVLSINTVSRIL